MEHRGWECSQKEAGPDDRLKPVWLLASGLKTPDAQDSLGHTLASVLSCIAEPCVSVGCCIRCWTTAPSAARQGPKVRWTVQGVGRPTQGRDRAHARTRACSRPLHSPQGWPGTPRSSRLHPGCHHASKEAHAWSCGTPATKRGSCVPAWNVPGGSAASQSSASHSGHKNVEGIAPRVAFRRGLVLQKTRERFQVLSGGSPVLSALSSCPRACACSHSAAENPTFRF